MSPGGHSKTLGLINCWNIFAEAYSIVSIVKQ